jgi:hypothetical protein
LYFACGGGVKLEAIWLFAAPVLTGGIGAQEFLILFSEKSSPELLALLQKQS